jgi:hypothetical protein
MPKIYHAKKPTFGNLDSLTNHHINRSNAYAFSTWNLQNKNNSALKKPLILFVLNLLVQTTHLKVVQVLDEKMGLSF